MWGKIFGIKNKGYIKEGFDADLTIVDMKKAHVTTPTKHLFSFLTSLTQATDQICLSLLKMGRRKT